ncbi:class I SAM-dependent methyltransferase [Asticcacaulis machinosus]|uniref:Class I SAM-dependent methyltransferase n=1 Tax=Asticcacaulis machinosus TaxID=2984211 RepID=A0ABT5HJS9_9CAUL|nr:class I SAM-dependent methyltransferase [Asticcacaulis machinosus]MDC7676499.1 class I SAM-dependent methyltransferase [Asticcacaulis machinosus]
MLEALRTRFNTLWQTDEAFNDPGHASDDAETILRVAGHGRALDVGCGNGSLVRALIRQGMDAFGIDISDVAIKRSALLTPDRFFEGQAQDLPFEDGRFDVVFSRFCLDELDENALTKALAEMKRVCSGPLILVVRTSAHANADTLPRFMDRNQWEEYLLAASFRKHPDHYVLNHLLNLHNGMPEAFFIMERGLEDESFLCMAGIESDARAFLAHRAALYVRPHDVVAVADTDAATAYVVARRTRAATVIAIAERAQAAMKAYSLPELPLHFTNQDANVIADTAIVYTSRNVIDELITPRWQLTPGGRLILFISGRPDLEIVSVASWKLETWLSLDVPAKGPPRILDRLQSETAERLCDECLHFLVFSLTPFFPLPLGLDRQPAPFKGTPMENYLNPWLMRALIVIGSRVENADIRKDWANHTLETLPWQSPDVGAALCNLIYMQLEDVEMDANLFEKARNYLTCAPANTTVLRWQISIAYALALRSRNHGQFFEMEQYLEYVLDRPAQDYSPLLLTKTVGAALMLAMLQLATGRQIEAASLLEKTYFEVRKLVGNALVGSNELPEAYETSEIVQIINGLGEMAAMAANLRQRIVRSSLLYEQKPNSMEIELEKSKQQIAKISAEFQSTIDYLAKVTEARDFFQGLYSVTAARLKSLNASE